MTTLKIEMFDMEIEETAVWDAEFLAVEHTTQRATTNAIWHLVIDATRNATCDVTIGVTYNAILEVTR